MLTDFESFTYDETYRAVGVCLAANVPVILWGKPGQGKTAVIQHFADLQKRKLETILASIREPQDFIGLPALRDEAMEYYAPGWAKRLDKEDRAGIIFFDEVSTAPPSVQAALLRVCLEKVVGELELDKETRIIAAANPTEMAADGWDLALPLANRFCHLQWMLPASIVAQGFSQGWPEYDVPPLDQSVFETCEAAEKILVSGFLRGNQQLVTVVPDPNSNAGGAFPSPRSWEMAAKLSAAVTALKLSEDCRRLLVAGCIGVAASNAFLAFRNTQDLPNAEDVIDNPDMDLPTRSDLLWVIGSSVLFAIAEKNSPQRWRQVEKFILRLFKMKQPDLAVAIQIQWSGLALQGESQSAELSRLMRPFREVEKQ
jgi:hypothetical protein